MICRGFAPIYTEKAKVLIVGSMPSVEPLRQAQYYAHPRNAFWPILFSYFGLPLSKNYDDRKRLIEQNELALWDSAGICEREGSLDSAMRDIVCNDFSGLFAECPKVETVLCNGKTAYSLFLKSGAGNRKSVHCLPSTSPAYTMAFAMKQRIWHEALDSADMKHRKEIAYEHG